MNGIDRSCKSNSSDGSNGWAIKSNSNRWLRQGNSYLSCSGEDFFRREPTASSSDRDGQRLLDALCLANKPVGIDLLQRTHLGQLRDLRVSQFPAHGPEVVLELLQGACSDNGSGHCRLAQEPVYSD